ncbi:MAG: nucleotidyltransferase family protein [Gallionella sp.]
MASSEIAHKRAQAFIFEALHLDTRLPEQASVLQMQAEDWDYLLQIAKEHRLGAMLHHRLKRDDLAHIIPEQVLTSLKAAYRKSALRSLVVYRELAKVTQLLEAEGIPSIALKGAYLARFAYPDPALRPMRDIDLLLKPEQAIKAFELLKGYGYRPMFDASPEAYLIENEHFAPLMSPEDISVELHHRLNESDQEQASVCGSEDEMWRRSLLKQVGGMQIRFLAPEDLLLHLCVHATVRHHFNLGALALADVVFLIETHSIDWGAFLKAVSTGGGQHCALALLYLAKKNMGANIPDKVIAALSSSKRDMLWTDNAEYLLFSALPDHRLATNGLSFLYTDSFFGKFDALIGFVFPRRSEMAKHFPIRPDSTSIMVLRCHLQRWKRLFYKTLAFLLKQKRPVRQLALHRTAFNNWLHEKSPH